MVQGLVEIRGGDFIGRDSIQYITNITHAGEDAEEVQSVIAHYLNALVNDLAGLKPGEIDAAAANPVPDSGELVGRGARGGSWLFRRNFSRCAFRNWYYSGNKLNYIGFRVVLRSAPVK